VKIHGTVLVQTVEYIDIPETTQGQPVVVELLRNWILFPLLYEERLGNKGGVSMIIGKPSRFAVEFELNDKYGGAWLFGKFCYWICDVCIGKYEDGTTLRDILACMPWMIHDNGNRRHHELFLMETEELYKKIDNALYGDGDSAEEEWARFEIKPLVDVFDDWKIYLVENDEETRIITQNQDCIREYKISPGEFDYAIRLAYNKLNDLYEKEENV